MEDETGTGTRTVEPLGVMAGLEPIAVVAICDGPAVTVTEVVLVLVVLHTTVVTLLWACVVVTLVETGDVSAKKEKQAML